MVRLTSFRHANLQFHSDCQERIKCRHIWKASTDCDIDWSIIGQLKRVHTGNHDLGINWGKADSTLLVRSAADPEGGPLIIVTETNGSTVSNLD